MNDAHSASIVAGIHRSAIDEFCNWRVASGHCPRGPGCKSPESLEGGGGDEKGGGPLGKSHTEGEGGEGEGQDGCRARGGLPPAHGGGGARGGVRGHRGAAACGSRGVPRAVAPEVRRRPPAPRARPPGLPPPPPPPGRPPGPPPPPPPPRPPRADPPPSMFARGMRAECPGRGDRGSGSARASAAPRARGTPPHQRPVQCPVAAGRRPPGRSRPRAPSGPQPVPPSGQRTQAPSPARGKVGGGAGRGGGGGGEWGAVWRTAHGF